MRRPAISPAETNAFLKDALDEVCSDFERTLERTSMKRKKSGQQRDDSGGGDGGYRYPSSDRNNNNQPLKGLSYNYQDKRYNGWSWDSPSYDVGGKSYCLTIFILNNPRFFFEFEIFEHF